MSFDLTSVETQLLQALGVILLAIAIAAGRVILKKLNIQLTDAQKAELEDVAAKSVTAGIVKSQDLIREKGWDHADVKNVVVAHAIDYAIQKFPDAMARSGIDADKPVQSAEKLADLMERKFPEAATAAAASPVTPLDPASTPPVPVVPVVSPITK
jgi:hypothetical protein